MKKSKQIIGKTRNKMEVKHFACVTDSLHEMGSTVIEQEITKPEDQSQLKLGPDAARFYFFSRFKTRMKINRQEKMVNGETEPSPTRWIGEAVYGKEVVEKYIAGSICPKVYNNNGKKYVGVITTKRGVQKLIEEGDIIIDPKEINLDKGIGSYEKN